MAGNKFRRELNKLLQETYNQIFFPKEDGRGFFFRFGLTFIFSLLLIETAILPQGLISLEIFLFLSLLLISINSFLGNAKTAATLTAVSVLISSISLHNSRINPSIIMEFIVFIISAISINLTINLSKRVDLGSEFGKREKHYLKQLEKAALEKREIIKELKAHDELISIASHELKTPLTSTLLKLQIALDNIKNVSLANFSIQNLLDMLESAEEQAQSLGKMINNLLSLSLLKSGRMQLDFEEADLGKITENIVNRFKERAKKEQIKIEYMGSSQKLTTVLDRVKIEQALTNLVSNAIKYGQKKPVYVELQKSGSNARISVRDEGIGITPDVQEKIFNLYERGSNHSSQSGLGIGLFVTNQIILAHKGKLLLKSKENKGSVFTLEIPLRR